MSYVHGVQVVWMLWPAGHLAFFLHSADHIAYACLCDFRLDVGNKHCLLPTAWTSWDHVSRPLLDTVAVLCSCCLLIRVFQGALA